MGLSAARQVEVPNEVWIATLGCVVAKRDDWVWTALHLKGVKATAPHLTRHIEKCSLNNERIPFALTACLELENRLLQMLDAVRSFSSEVLNRLIIRVISFIDLSVS